VSRWQRYWFAEGGRTALAIVRIAVATSVIFTLFHVIANESPVAASVYRPVGIWMLLGHIAPPGWLVQALWVIAWVSTAAMLVGFATRASTATSFVSAVAIAALTFSASRTWSHQYNVVFLAQLALLGARSGDTLSIDAWLRRRRGLPLIDVARGYQWSLRLAQLAVVLMFAGAAFHKLAHGHFTLRWAFSDNLRHHLLVRYDLAGTPRPAFVDWLLAESWRYQGAALLNMITQAAPLLAVIFVRRPLVRLLAAALFTTEVLMLGVVVELWNLHWLPLVAVFIDWEWLLRMRRESPERPEPHDPHVPPAGWRAPRGVTAFVIAFLVYDVVTAFVPTVDQRLNTFPFSSFPMFATIRARRPYGEHQAYSVVAGTYEVISEVPVYPAAQRWLDHIHRNVQAVRDPVELEKRLRDVLAQLQHFYPDFRAHGIRLWITVFEAPAYPAPAQFAKKPIALLGEIAADGTFHTMLGKRELPADTRLVYYRDERAEAIAVPVEGSIDAQLDKLPGNPRYLVAIIKDTPWLLGSKSTWTWN
jgi:hypothetical protein